MRPAICKQASITCAASASLRQEARRPASICAGVEQHRRVADAGEFDQLRRGARGPHRRRPWRATAGRIRRRAAPASGSGSHPRPATGRRASHAGVRKGTAMPGSYSSRQRPSGRCRARWSRDSVPIASSVKLPNGAETARTCASIAANDIEHRIDGRRSRRCAPARPPRSPGRRR